MIGKALATLSDMANCVSNDFHLMHLQYKGAEFDTMHKKTLKKYYEEAADDYDEWAEAALMFPETVLGNPSNSATRVQWQVVEQPQGIGYEEAVAKTDQLLSSYVAALTLMFSKLNVQVPAECGIQSTVQDRLAYWTKELEYFNKRRALIKEGIKE